jgi:hypothetical protein
LAGRWQKPRSNPEGEGNGNGSDCWVGDGLHPTHRKCDGWGTRFVVAGEERRRQQQIPFGDDNKKSKGKNKNIGNGDSDSDSKGFLCTF